MTERFGGTKRSASRCLQHR